MKNVTTSTRSHKMTVTYAGCGWSGPMGSGVERIDPIPPFPAGCRKRRLWLCLSCSLS